MGSGAVRIRRTKDGDKQGKPTAAATWHCAGNRCLQTVGSAERGGAGEKRPIAVLPTKTNRGGLLFRRQFVFGNFLLGCCSKENYIRVRVEAETVHKISEAIRRASTSRNRKRPPAPNGKSRAAIRGERPQDDKVFFRLAATGLRKNVERYGRIHPANELIQPGAAQKLEIIKLFMRRNFTEPLERESS